MPGRVQVTQKPVQRRRCSRVTRPQGVRMLAQMVIQAVEADVAVRIDGDQRLLGFLQSEFRHCPP
ncbi:hypothetical protein GCM10010378_46000 [Streptomyces viridochromogenes]